MIEDMCDYVNSSWEVKTAIHLSAYVMWRLNWIHPFTDGNGRTSRAASYLILCLKTGYLLPGKLTIPDQISQDRIPYYHALEAADRSLATTGSLVLGEMETLLSSLLARQLLQVMNDAGGNPAHSIA
jgi:Fic family protein